MTPNWDDLRVFLAVARAEGLTAAAKALRLDPATLSRRITRLEGVLDRPLFTKSPQGYALTAAGQRLFEQAQTAETALQGAVAEARGSADTLSGSIRIGAPDGCATYILPQVCRALARDYPDLEIQVVALPRVFNLSKREADMAIAVSRPAAGRLTVQRLTDYRLHLAAHRDYLAAHPRITGVADLAAHRIIGYIPDMIFDRELDYQAQVGTERLAFASNSVPVQLHAILAGAGVGIVHDFALPFAPGLVRVLPGQVSLTRSFYLIRHADDRRVARLNLIAAALAGHVRSEVGRLEQLT